jgi:hypothetical protein
MTEKQAMTESLIMLVVIVVYYGAIFTYKLSVILFLALINLHGLIVRLLVIPIRDIPLMLWQPSPDGSFVDSASLRKMSFVWRVVVPPVLGALWFIVLHTILLTSSSEAIAFSGTAASTILAVVSYYRIYSEFPLAHPTAMRLLEEESMMRLESSNQAVEQTVTLRRSWHNFWNGRQQ